MKNNYGFSNILIILISLLVVSLFAYKIFYSSEDQITLDNTKKPFNNKIDDNVNICKDFNDFSDFISKTILSPEVKKEYVNLKEEVDNPYSKEYFVQSRGEKNEPLMAFPIHSGTFYEYQDIEQPKSKNELKNIFETNINLLKVNMNEKAQELGFREDELNNVAVRKNDRHLRQKFSYAKGGDVYSIELTYFNNSQTIDYHNVAITCGQILPLYNNIYEYIISSRFNRWNEDEILRVIEISDDGQIISVQNTFLETSQKVGLESRTLGTNVKYYIVDLDYNYIPLTESESGYSSCSFFENLKIGKGLNCMRKGKEWYDYTVDKVVY